MFNRKKIQKNEKAKDEREAKIAEIQALAYVLIQDIERGAFECEITRSTTLKHMERNLKTIIENCEDL